MTEEDDDSRLDASNMHGAPKYAHGNAGKTGATRRMQPQIRIRETQGIKKLKKNSSGMTQ